MSKQFKAIFTDVDGTLITSKRHISPGTKDILTRLHNQGILISPVTARSPDATMLIFKELEMPDNPVICFNGALILRNNTIISDLSIDAKTVKEIKDVLQSFDLTTTVYSYRDWFVDKIDDYVQRESNVTKTKINLVNFNDFFAGEKQHAHKILFMGKPDIISAAQKYLKSLNQFNVTISSSKTTYLEIVHNRASKKQGIERVMETYNIKNEEIIVIGDNYNDIDMLAYANTSIAMGNAPDDVKQYAKIITDTNNKEGIQKALEKLFF